MDRPETEILVHVAAPARVADDTKYRSFAAGYLNFVSARRIPVVHVAPADNEQEVSDGSDDAEAEAAPPPTQDGGSIKSPLMSFQSVINNLGSPRLQHAEIHSLPEPQSSWHPPPSVIEDSMPDNDLALLQYCTPTRLLEHYTSTFGKTQSVSPVSHTRQNQTLPASSQPQRRSPDRQSTKDSSQHQALPDDPGTVIPLSPGDDKRPRPPTPTTSGIVEETRIASSYPSQPSATSSSFRAESEPPLPKRARTSQDPDPGKPLVRSASDIGPRRAKTHVLYHQPPDTLEILSPPPLTSHRELRAQDMITDVLASLARELNLEKRFKPESQARDLRPFERGYWLVDCSAWEPDLKQSAWGFLADYLGKGAAGWGTSCSRDRDFSWIRLNCWGCVVGHMYLVLYLMSRRRVLYTGASWVGAEGKAVVVMGARPGPV
ncbi:hypothetical protein C8A01DRAFT_14279 [Parachaetomium inaequale]|uniref:Uncharacterized protein n=1 Tax=Parachaetomium inaequale TaxID=2588326 RepID=A0AAN6PK02_9PEZI|nr:hypothetical protein C8A01DRAFT_14279 [Parachaetomium inaequale]